VRYTTPATQRVTVASHISGMRLLGSGKSPRPQLKDETLDELANIANVAQFISFGPSTDLPQRFSRIVGHEQNYKFATPALAISALLSVASGSSVNVRSFKAEASKGGPFTYELRTASEVLKILRQRASDGFYTIVNETIDVNDGGVSGVALGGIIEFTPEDTPRGVEKPGVVALEKSVALRLFEIVYGFTPELDYKPNERIEFSIHPLGQGIRRSHTLVWEREHVGSTELSSRLIWPNRFSRFIGDKAFGLLVAELLDLPIPATTVVGRKIAPFHFGQSTGSAETWTRTCPVEPQPGRFLTQRGWVDPFVLLAQEDPKGVEIASILAQEGVIARYSGAAMPQSGGGGMLVEGVPGFGEAFMQGEASPSALPDQVIRDVSELAGRAASQVGPVRLEWVHDGERAWIVQLHLAPMSWGSDVIYPGEPTGWRSFDPTEGLDRLRTLITAAVASGEGIEVTGNVGITSHVGDLLRKAEVPSRFSESR
jgi:hypothetical protein